MRGRKQVSIESMGRVVRPQSDQDGFVIHHIFIKGKKTQVLSLPERWRTSLSGIAVVKTEVHLRSSFSWPRMAFVIFGLEICGERSRTGWVFFGFGQVAA